MKDKNYEGLANRLLCNGKVVPVATAVIFSVLSPGLVIAEPGIVENPAGQDIILENSVSENLAPDSQPLNLDALSSAPAAELSAVDEPAADSSAAPIAELSAADEPAADGSAAPPAELSAVDEPAADSSAAPTAELSAADEPAADSSAAPTKLALAEQVLQRDSSMTGMVKEPDAIDTGSAASADGESPQKPYALILALVALISLVPMSRRHH